MLPSTRLALIAFLAHGPGLRLFTSYRFGSDLARTNVIALALTIAATLGAAAACAGHRFEAGVTAFVIGHFCWSIYLARYVVRREGRRGEEIAAERRGG